MSRVALVVELAGIGLFADCGGSSSGYENLIFIARKTGDYVIRLPVSGNHQPEELEGALPWDSQAVWLPDGTRIAFYSDRLFDLTNANVDIYVMKADGSNMTRLTQAVSRPPSRSGRRTANASPSIVSATATARLRHGSGRRQHHAADEPGRR